MTTTNQPVHVTRPASATTNPQFWGGQLTEEQLDAVDTSSSAVPVIVG